MSQEPRRKPETFALLPKILNGGIGAIIGVTSIFPLDLVKTRLQKQPIGPNGEKMYKNIMSQEPRRKPETFALLPKILNGGIGAIIGVTSIFPLDLVKTRLQKQPIGPNGEKMYKNMLDCFMKVYRAEGYFGMYRGIAVNLVLVTPEKAIKLAANDYFRYHLTTPEGELTVSRQTLAGGIAGLFQVLISTPMELLKIQMQDAGRVAAQARETGRDIPKITAIEITKNLMKEKGIFGLYKGVSATLYRDIGFSMIYFPVFAALNALGPRKSDGSGEAVFWCSFLSGLAAGCVSAFSATPFDVIKTRLQTVSKVEGEKIYHGFMDCAIQTMKQEGPAAFFKGGLCRIMVIAPLYGITQVVYFLGIGEALLGVKKTQA